MLAVSQSELDKAPVVGSRIRCRKCGKSHKIVNSTANGQPGILQFYKCGRKLYLAGMFGKKIK
jgi:hypothetical protein